MNVESGANETILLQRKLENSKGLHQSRADSIPFFRVGLGAG